ncbi:hypothetical protein V1511DRAFT_513225 [Dipodascopsis uninucleata]
MSSSKRKFSNSAVAQRNKRPNTRESIPDQDDNNRNNTSQPKKNTAVYLSNLPDDVTFEELEAVVSRYGLIAEDITTKKKRIKIYEDENGKPKGDALVVFFRPESVQLTVDMMDETDLRLGKSDRKGKIRVQPADYNYKVEKDPQPMKERSIREKRDIIKSVQKLNSKLADWDDGDIEEEKPRQKRWNKMVIFKHVFTLKELEDDISASLDIKEDIREGCEEIGEVTNVVLYDLEPEGIISVRFKNDQDALECVKRMDGRYFGGQQLEVSIYDGNQRFRKSDRKKEDNQTEEERLQKFGEWLENDGDDYNDDDGN